MRTPHQQAAFRGVRDRQKKQYPFIPENHSCGNPHIIQYEKYILCRLMLHGKKYRYPFTDKRHEVIYSHLECLQGQVFQPTTEQLIQYLSEYGLLGQAGGLGYIRAAFQGLP